MARSLKLRAKAQRDLEQAVRWYEAERSQLGEEFFLAVRDLLKEVCEAPLHHPAVFGQTRRAVLHRFPYAVLFRLSRETVDVVAVFHTSRDPRRWQAREPATAYEPNGLAA